MWQAKPDRYWSQTGTKTLNLPAGGQPGTGQTCRWHCHKSEADLMGTYSRHTYPFPFNRVGAGLVKSGSCQTSTVLLGSLFFFFLLPTVTQQGGQKQTHRVLLEHWPDWGRVTWSKHMPTGVVLVMKEGTCALDWFHLDWTLGYLGVLGYLGCMWI